MRPLESPIDRTAFGVLVRTVCRQRLVRARRHLQTAIRPAKPTDLLLPRRILVDPVEEVIHVERYSQGPAAHQCHHLVGILIANIRRTTGSEAAVEGVFPRLRNLYVRVRRGLALDVRVRN